MMPLYIVLAITTLAVGWEFHLALALCPLAAAAIVAIIRYGSRGGGDQPETQRHARLACQSLLALLIVVSGLWLWGGGALFTKDAGESHAVYLAASNIHNLTSLFVQDLSPSPDPAAHPFYYTHSPNLPSQVLSFLLIESRIPLGQQVYITALIGIVALAYGYVALSRLFSGFFALGAIGFLVLAYNAFYYNLGDLLRGLLYVWFWLALGALARDRPLEDRSAKLAIAALSATIMVSDWGFAVFFYAFLFLWTAYTQSRLPLRSYLLWVMAPAAAALLAYEAAVVSAVGWDFFLHDLDVTYLGRMGIGGTFDALSAFRTYQQHHVVLGLGSVQQTLNFADLLAALAVAPALTMGPLWPGFLGISVTTMVRSCAAFGLSRWTWGVLLIADALAFAGVLPLQTIALACAAAAFPLAKLRRHDATPSPVARILIFVTVLWLALLIEGAVFPSTTLIFVIGQARPPLPLPEMSAAGLAIHLLFHARHHRLSWHDLTAAIGKWLESRGRAVALAVTLLACLCAPFVSLARSGAAIYGFPAAVAIGIAAFNLVVAGSAAGILSVSPAGLGDALAGRYARSRRILLLSLRVALPALIVPGLIFMARYHSAAPTVFARYSTRYALTLFAAGTLGAIGILFAWKPHAIPNAVEKLRHFASRRGVGDSGLLFAASCAGLLYAAWFCVSLAGHPPQSPPYAALLSHAPYRGASFLTSTDGPVAWYYTRGWTYLTDSNPPAAGDSNIRYRHFADWANAQKYGHPEYYLCDNTIFSAMRPGQYDVTWFRSPPPDLLSCSAGDSCTCHDVAKRLAEEGNSVEVDRKDFSIVRFNWSKPAGGQPPDLSEKRAPPTSQMP